MAFFVFVLCFFKFLPSFKFLSLTHTLLLFQIYGTSWVSFLVMMNHDLQRIIFPVSKKRETKI